MPGGPRMPGLRSMNHQSVVPPASKGQKPLPFPIREEDSPKRTPTKKENKENLFGPLDLQESGDDTYDRSDDTGGGNYSGGGVSSNSAALELLLGQLDESQRKYQKALDKIRQRDAEIVRQKTAATSAAMELAQLREAAAKAAAVTDSAEAEADDGGSTEDGKGEKKWATVGREADEREAKLKEEVARIKEAADEREARLKEEVARLKEAADEREAKLKGEVARLESSLVDAQTRLKDEEAKVMSAMASPRSVGSDSNSFLRACSTSSIIGGGVSGGGEKAKEMLGEVMSKMEVANKQLVFLQEEVGRLKGRVEMANAIAEAERARASSYEAELEIAKAMLSRKESRKEDLIQVAAKGEVSATERLMMAEVEGLRRELETAKKEAMASMEEIASLRCILGEGGFGANEVKRKLDEQIRFNAELQSQLEMSEAKEIMARTAAKDALTSSLRSEVEAKKEEIRILQAESFRARAERDATSARLQQVMGDAADAEGKHKQFQARQEALIEELASIRKDVIRIVNKRSAMETALSSCSCGVVESASAAWQALNGTWNEPGHDKSLTDDAWKATSWAAFDRLTRVDPEATYNLMRRSLSSLDDVLLGLHSSSLATGGPDPKMYASAGSLPQSASSAAEPMTVAQSMTMPLRPAERDAAAGGAKDSEKEKRERAAEKRRAFLAASGVGNKEGEVQYPPCVAPTQQQQQQQSSVVGASGWEDVRSGTQKILDALTLAGNPKTMRMAIERYTPPPPEKECVSAQEAIPSGTSLFASSPPEQETADNDNDTLTSLPVFSPVRVEANDWELGMEHEEMTPNGHIIKIKPALPTLTEERSFDGSPLPGKTEGDKQLQAAASSSSGGEWAPVLSPPVFATEGYSKSIQTRAKRGEEIEGLMI